MRKYFPKLGQHARNDAGVRRRTRSELTRLNRAPFVELPAGKVNKDTQLECHQTPFPHEGSSHPTLGLTKTVSGVRGSPLQQYTLVDLLKLLLNVSLLAIPGRTVCYKSCMTLIVFVSAFNCIASRQIAIFPPVLNHREQTSISQSDRDLQKKWDALYGKCPDLQGISCQTGRNHVDGGLDVGVCQSAS